jgi:hypothetical protein
MAYRGDDGQDALEAPTADGLLKVVLGPNRVDLSVGPLGLHIADRIATVVEHKKQRQERRASIKLTGNVVIARGFPREALGIWIEHEVVKGSARARPMQRIFGVDPVSLLEREGLGALGRLDGIAQRLRAHLSDLAGTIRRAIEIGSGHALDKVLLVDHGDRYTIYARRLFRDRARFAMEVHEDGRVVVPDGKRTREVEVARQFGVTVRGDNVRFADRNHVDVAKVSLPWIGPEDRDEVARRIAAFIER